MKSKDTEIPQTAEFQKEVDKIICTGCTEDFLFHLKVKDESFTIGLRDILECVSFAEKQGAIPPLPFDWWLDVKTHFRLE